MERHTSTSRTRTATYHLYAWAGYALFFYLLNLTETNYLHWSSAIALTVLFTLVFYPVLFLLYRYVRPRRYGQGLLLFLVYFLVVLPTVYFLAVYVAYPGAGIRIPFEDVAFSATEFFKHYGIGVFRFSVYAIVYYAVDRRLQAERARSAAESLKLAAENKALKAETERLEYELASLHQQLSPHLMNSVLQKLYVRALPQDEVLATRVLGLAELSSYSTAASLAGSGIVGVQQEVDTLLTLARLADVDMSLDLPARQWLPAVPVPRMVLVTLLENAVKFSPTTSPANTVHVRLRVSHSRLYFVCKNRKGTAKRHEASLGTGLANLRRRLAIHFGDRASLAIWDAGDTFTATLEINYPNANTSNKRTRYENDQMLPDG